MQECQVSLFPESCPIQMPDMGEYADSQLSLGIAVVTTNPKHHLSELFMYFIALLRKEAETVVSVHGIGFWALVISVIKKNKKIKSS